MDKNILIANIGNRNLKYDNAFIEKKDKGFFEFTEMLRNDFESEKGKISINILNSILKDYPIDKIYLIVTNQGYHQDTYYEGLIIKELLKDKYDIELIEKKDDPRNREKAFQFIEDFFNKYKFEDKKIITCGSGGIPAMKEALNFYSVLKVKNSIILDVDENNETIFSSDVQNEYLKNVDKEKIRGMIEKYNYNGAKSFLETSRICNKTLGKLLEYAANRLEFIFTEIVDKHLPRNPESIEENICELLQNIQVSYRKGDYSIAIAKLYALQESLIKNIFESYVGFSCEDWDKIEHLGFNIKSNQKGKRYIDIRDILGYINENFSRLDDREKKLKHILDQLFNMKDIRNESFIAHGMNGITKTESKELYNLVEELFHIYGLKTNDNIFQKLNQYLISLI